MFSMFQGGDGKVSSMRVMTFATVAIVLAVYIVHNIVSMFHGNGYVTMSWQDVAIISAALGIKMAQTGFENAAGGSSESDAAGGTEVPAEVDASAKK